MAGQNGLGPGPHGVVGQEVDQGVRQAVELGKIIRYSCGSFVEDAMFGRGGGEIR